MSEELKPCPFCGGAAGKDEGGWIACTSAKCPAYNFVGTEDDWNIRTTHPAPESVGGEKMRERFSQIEDEIMAGKHTASSVFTQMRTAALYMAATVPAGSRLVPVELLRDLLDEGPRAATWAAQDKLRAILEAKQ